MSGAKIRISTDEVLAEQEDRFHRFRLIGWWEQTRLTRAKVLVVGAGALGNELVKNLALLGVGNVLVADMDRIENSNLSRSVLFRGRDNGQLKAGTAARAAMDIFPGMKAHAFNGNVVHDLGMGVFRWADVVLAGLDNREARLAINRHCQRLARPWIDGAIEGISGVARIFGPDGPCYECTMSQIDWQLLEKRRSCNLLSRNEMEGGKTPTTPTISSIIGGVQCQEAVKLLHGMETLDGRGWVFDGVTADAYWVEYQRKDECYSHERLDEVIPLDVRAATTTAGELLQMARRLVCPTVEIEFARDVLERLVCHRCGAEEPLFTSLGSVGIEKASCPQCGHGLRNVQTFYKIRGNESFLDRTLEAIGVPAFDIVICRTAERVVGLELTGDAAGVLGSLAGSEEGLEWA